MTDDDIKQLQWDLARARAMHAQAARDRDHYRQALPVGHWKTVSATYAATHYGFPPTPDTGDLHTARDGSVWMFNVDVTGAWSLSEPGVEDVSALVVELAETERERQKAVALERDTAERAQRERVASDRLVDTMDQDFRALRDAVLASGAVVVRGAGGVVTGVVLPSDPDLVACREQLRQESERADREAAEASSLRDEVDRLTRQRDEALAGEDIELLPESVQRAFVRCAESGRRNAPALDVADPGDLRTVADFLERYTAAARSEHPGERPEWSAADLRCKAEYLEESDALIERVARVIYETDERAKTPKREWASRSDALRADYLANARALHAAGLLTDGEQQ